ncbi:MAG: hypothetical protein KDD60_08990 [Bdellovibrionales bacterium]|nr:hypothetical protein [Bdellovibrionales bacterium]
MAQQHCLEITRLSADGQILKTIYCRSARVSVFRSHNTELLEHYINALSGHSTPLRITMLLDGRGFNPQEHIVLGYSEPNISWHKTVGTVLQEFGLPLSEIPPLLLSHGLGGLSDIEVSELAAPELHGLALLSATASNSPVLIVKDPLLPIREQWREAYAKRLTQFAWEKQAIVIVPQLSCRPESWIENDLISRIQIDETVRKATIGVGSISALTDMAKQLRQEFQADPVPRNEKVQKLDNEKKPQLPRNAQISRWPHFLNQKLAISLCLVIIAALFWTTSPGTMISPIVTSKKESQAAQPNDSRTAQRESLNPPPSIPTKESLAGYDEAIVTAILKSFREEVDLNHVKSLEQSPRTNKSTSQQSQRTITTHPFNSSRSRGADPFPFPLDQSHDASEAKMEAIEKFREIMRMHEQQFERE